jgi:hypothetical protein
MAVLLALPHDFPAPQALKLLLMLDGTVVIGKAPGDLGGARPGRHAGRLGPLRAELPARRLGRPPCVLPVPQMRFKERRVGRIETIQAAISPSDAASARSRLRFSRYTRAATIRPTRPRAQTGQDFPLDNGFGRHLPADDAGPRPQLRSGTRQITTPRRSAGASRSIRAPGEFASALQRRPGQAGSGGALDRSS